MPPHQRVLEGRASQYQRPAEQNVQKDAKAVKPNAGLGVAGNGI